MSAYWIPRLQIAVNKIALKVLRFPVPETIRGVDSSLTLCDEMAAAGLQRVLLVTDGPLMRTGIPERLAAHLRQRDVAVEVFSDVEPDPDYALVLRGVERLNAFNAQAVLAVGGGSPIDCAKSMLMCQATGKHPSKLTGVWLYHLPRPYGLPLYAIPTTSGTGSEATVAAIVSDRAEQTKYSIIDPKLLPIKVALDPALTVGLPPAVTAATGMDALTHAVEAYIGTMGTKETNAWALRATELIGANLSKAYALGTDIEARANMQEAALLAGLAFTRATVGYVHAIAHQLGGLYHVPHGLANAIVMPHVLDFCKSACTDRLADLARAAGIAVAGANDTGNADRMIAWIREMNAAMGIPSTVSALREADFDRIIAHALTEAHGTYAIPRYMQKDDARGILRQLLATN